MARINDDGFLELSGVSNKVFQEVLNAERFSILEGLSPLSLRVLNQASHVLNVAEGVEMMHAGDTPHDLYFISKGSVAMTKLVKGKTKVVAKLISGNFYGEYGALRRKTRYVSVYTAEASEIVRIDLTAVQQVFDSDDAFKDKVYSVMHQRVMDSFLFNHPVFSTLTKASRDMLIQALDVLEVDRGTEIFKEGSLADKYYFIISGEVEVTIVMKDKLVVFDVRRENSLIGESRINDGEEYAYSAYAANSLDLLVLDNLSLQVIKKASPEVIPLLNQLISHSAKKTSLVTNNVLQKHKI